MHVFRDASRNRTTPPTNWAERFGVGVNLAVFFRRPATVRCNFFNSSREMAQANLSLMLRFASSAKFVFATLQSSIAFRNRARSKIRFGFSWQRRVLCASRVFLPNNYVFLFQTIAHCCQPSRDLSVGRGVATPLWSTMMPIFIAIFKISPLHLNIPRQNTPGGRIRILGSSTLKTVASAGALTTCVSISSLLCAGNADGPSQSGPQA